MPSVIDVPPLSRPAGILREARRCLPERTHDLAKCEVVPVAVLFGAVASETLDSARDADASGPDIVQRIAAAPLLSG